MYARENDDNYGRPLRGLFAQLTNQAESDIILLLLLLPILCRAASSAALSHTGGFRVGGGDNDNMDHDSYTFQCGLVGSFTSSGIDTR